MINKQRLITNIEILREQLYKYLNDLAPTDLKVVTASQKLDRLISFYYKIN